MNKILFIYIKTNNIKNTKKKSKILLNFYQKKKNKQFNEKSI
jgi:hypothetical protein